MDNKDYKPATEPVIRTRHRNPALYNQAAQAQAQQQAAVPTGYVRPDHMGDMQTPAVRKRSSEQVLTAPVVYEPSGRELRAPSVKPVQFSDLGNRIASRSAVVFVLISIVFGVASGIFLLWLNGNNSILNGTDISSYGDGGMTAHCLIWGGVLGLLFGLILTPIYHRLRSSLPAYAALLFLPVLHFLLTPLMYAGTELIIALVGAVISLIGAAFGLFIVWTFICGG